MSLSFLVPAFFVGLLALGVPILIHLSRRETREPLAFPSLMFLEKLPQKRTEKRRIHRWPLFLLRCLAVGLLVLAFARPFVEREGSASPVSTTGSREVVVLVDRSYSMGIGDRWQQAVQEATEVVDGLGSGDRGTIIMFDSGAESATESTTDRDVLRTALRTAEPGVRTTRYGPGLRYAGRILAASPLPRHELYVISDFQRIGWDADGGETSSIRLPTGTVVNPISIGGGEVGVNVVIAGAEFERTLVADRERVTIQARVTSSGGTVGSVPVTLEVDGRAVETNEIDLAESGSGQVTFAPLTLPITGATRGTLRVPSDDLPLDNELHFVLSADQRIPVLIVDGPGSSQNASYFLQRALALGSNPGFRSEVRRSGELRATDFGGNTVVILNQSALPNGEQGERLRSYVERGGGLIMLLGTNTLGDWPEVLPNVPAAVDRTQMGGVTLGFVDTGHPVFEAFAGPRTGDFSSARVYRYRPIPAGSFPRVLARFGDGGTALVERPVEGGRVLVWSSPLDGSWSDFTLQPVFLPFLHQLVKYAAGYTPPQSWLTVGDPFDASGILPPQDVSGIALTPSDDRVEVGAGDPLEMSEVGFYEIRDARGAGPLVTLAANADRVESDRTTFDPQELVNALQAGEQTAAEASAGATLTLAEKERQQSGWWYLIVLAFVLLAVESLFSNWRKIGAGDLTGWWTRRRGTKDRNPGLAA